MAHVFGNGIAEYHRIVAKSTPPSASSLAAFDVLLSDGFILSVELQRSNSDTDLDSFAPILQTIWPWAWICQERRQMVEASVRKEVETYVKIFGLKELQQKLKTNAEVELCRFDNFFLYDIILGLTIPAECVPEKNFFQGAFAVMYQPATTVPGIPLSVAIDGVPFEVIVTELVSKEGVMQIYTEQDPYKAPAAEESVPYYGDGDSYIVCKMPDPMWQWVLSLPDSSGIASHLQGIFSKICEENRSALLDPQGPAIIGNPEGVSLVFEIKIEDGFDGLG